MSCLLYSNACLFIFLCVSLSETHRHTLFFPFVILSCLSIQSFRLCKFTGRSWNQVSVRQQSGHEILSQSIKIEVYAPLRIHPDDIFLVPGACYMV
jgi:hypothetical protein